MKKERKEVRFGFWHSMHEPDLPTPHVSIYDNSEIIEKLKKIQSICESTGMLAPFHGQIVRYRGFSVCRICNHANGSAEYQYVQEDGTIYTWPSGLIHYLEQHNIEPPSELRQMFGYHELKWKLVRENAKMELFPFNVTSTAMDGSLYTLWNRVKPKGIMWRHVSGQIQSPTTVRLIVQTDDKQVVFDEVLTVPENELSSLIYSRKFSIAEDEYNERTHAQREHEILKIMKEIFGD